MKTIPLTRAIAGCLDEDAADIAMYDARKAELTGRDDALPREVGDLVLRGHTRLKAIRTWCGLVQRDVAAEAGIAQGYLSDLESGRKTGSMETIEKLARILDVPIKWFR
ncbi:helix-turn-helix transcriptional regulator [Aquibium sp. LZ166]|uniref:Helix-turn-helix transcriptional regulator n=1 Tax=Aquibium pacificus TaxID=3153579 RepID=A0ABV3SJC0_9HYPH